MYGPPRGRLMRLGDGCDTRYAASHSFHDRLSSGQTQLPDGDRHIRQSFDVLEQRPGLGGTNPRSPREQLDYGDLDHLVGEIGDQVVDVGLSASGSFPQLNSSYACFITSPQRCHTLCEYVVI